MICDYDFIFFKINKNWYKFVRIKVVDGPNTYEICYKISTNVTVVIYITLLS